MPPHALASFDAPNGDCSCPRRTRSNTPLATLSALSGTEFFDSAWELAIRGLRAATATDRDRADDAFKLCVCRTPTAAGRHEVMSLYQSQRTRLADGWISSRPIATGNRVGLQCRPRSYARARSECVDSALVGFRPHTLDLSISRPRFSVGRRSWRSGEGHPRLERGPDCRARLHELSHCEMNERFIG